MVCPATMVSKVHLDWLALHHRGSLLPRNLVAEFAHQVHAVSRVQLAHQAQQVPKACQVKLVAQETTDALAHLETLVQLAKLAGQAFPDPKAKMDATSLDTLLAHQAPLDHLDHLAHKAIQANKVQQANQADPVQLAHQAHQAVTAMLVRRVIPVPRENQVFQARTPPIVRAHDAPRPPPKPRPRLKPSYNTSRFGAFMDETISNTYRLLALTYYLG